MIWELVGGQKKDCHITPASLLSSWIHSLVQVSNITFFPTGWSRRSAVLLRWSLIPILSASLTVPSTDPLPSTLICLVPRFPSSQSAPPASTTHVLGLLFLHSCLNPSQLSPLCPGTLLQSLQFQSSTLNPWTPYDLRNTVSALIICWLELFALIQGCLYIG